VTKEEFAAIRAAAGMTFGALANYLGVILRSVQRYEAGDRHIPGPVEKLMRQLEEKHGNRPKWDEETARKRGKK